MSVKWGIVGNRIGWTAHFVFNILANHNITSNDTIISGGAKGVDTYAQDYAEYIGCKMIIFYPNPIEESPKKYFSRNLKIAQECDILIAFNKNNSPSGTLNTINQAKILRKKVVLIAAEEKGKTQEVK
jgi:hypothetical protein